MPAPVIFPVTSILGFPQWESWIFQPVASNTPTSWSISTVPPGMSFNTTTGRLSGAATTAGVYDVELIATNADGSGSIKFPIGIWLAAYAPNSALNVDWDTQSGEISIRGLTAQASTGARLAALLSAKEDDDLLFFVRLLNQNTVLDLALTSLSFGAKEFEPEAIVVLSSTDFVKIGTGTSTYYILHAHLDRAKLKNILSGYEADSGTLFAALGEFERVEANLGYPDLTAGPATLRRTSRTFVLNIERDLIQT